MLEILAILLAIAVVAIGVIVRGLFGQVNQVRSGFESRIQAIETLEGPFGRKLTEAGPAPLMRALTLAVHLDARFWTETLGLTASELDEVKRWILWHDVLSKKAAAEDFDKWFYGDITVDIQEWRGGYTHVKVEYPLCPSEKKKTVDLYEGEQHGRLWRFDVPARPGVLGSSTLWLDWDGHRVRLYATGGRFGWASLTDTSPAPGNVFLTVPMSEGPEAEEYYSLADCADFYPPMWSRRYQHLDLQKGLAWSLRVHDCGLLVRSEGNARASRDLLFAEWRARFAWNDAGKEWLERFTKMYDDREASMRAKWAEQAAASEQSWKCQCGAVVDRTEFGDACPHCGESFDQEIAL
jgi:hypothetical protein